MRQARVKNYGKKMWELSYIVLERDGVFSPKISLKATNVSKTRFVRFSILHMQNFPLITHMKEYTIAVQVVNLLQGDLPPNSNPV